MVTAFHIVDTVAMVTAYTVAMVTLHYDKAFSFSNNM